MKFDLRAPCKHCPFRTDHPAFLSGERVKGIIEDQNVFACHKTIKHNDNGQPLKNMNDQACAGFLIFHFKGGNGDWPVNMKIAAAFGLLPIKEVYELDAPVFDSKQEMIDAQPER